MAVQKKRKTPSRRGMRRSHDALSGSALSIDSTTGEVHLRHHVTADGFYKGRKVISTPEEEESEEGTPDDGSEDGKESTSEIDDSENGDEDHSDVNETSDEP